MCPRTPHSVAAPTWVLLLLLLGLLALALTFEDGRLLSHRRIARALHAASTANTTSVALVEGAWEVASRAVTAQPEAQQQQQQRDNTPPVAPPKSLEASLHRTAAEEAEASAFRDAASRLDGASFFRWLADSPVPIPPWRPGRARPIVCDGAEYYSVYFSIPPGNIVASVPKKLRDWATVVPGRRETYIFREEAAYRADLEASRFAITRRRFGFATNRNLEILAAGSVPYFCGIERLPQTGTLASHPLDIFRKVMRFPGVTARCYPHKKAFGAPIDRQSFNETVYERLATKLLAYARSSMTTELQALYVLSASSLMQLPKSVLVLWASHYTIALTGVIDGLRRLGVRVEDVPRRAEIYRGEGCEEARRSTYAKGWFFFCKTDESPHLSRANISARIAAREFDVVIISVTDTLTYHMKDPHSDIPHYTEIIRRYPRDLIITINDADLIKPMQADVAHKFMHNSTIYFKRETHGCREPIW